MTKVKICGLTRRQDAELAVELGADALGFVFDPASPRYIGGDPEKADIPKRVGPFGPLCVAVYGTYREGITGCSAIQYIDGAVRGLTRLRVYRPRASSPAAFHLASVKRLLTTFPAAIVLDAYSPNLAGGSGEKLDWNLAAEIIASTKSKVVLAGGLTPDNVREAIKRVRPYAVDVSSGVESSPGIKDRGKLKAFIQAVKSA